MPPWQHAIGSIRLGTGVVLVECNITIDLGRMVLGVVLSGDFAGLVGGGRGNCGYHSRIGVVLSMKCDVINLIKKCLRGDLNSKRCNFLGMAYLIELFQTPKY